MLAGTAEVFTVTVPAWLLAALAFLGTVLGGAISFAVNQLLIKGAADRAAKKREKEDEQRRERYILQTQSERCRASKSFQGITNNPGYKFSDGDPTCLWQAQNTGEIAGNIR